MKKNIYIDLEWFLTEEIFLLGYAYTLGNWGQLHGEALTKENILLLFQGVENIFFYGPDAAKLEKSYGIKLKRNFYCINLLTAVRQNLSLKSYSLKSLEKRYGIGRKENYHTNIFQLFQDWKNPEKKKAALLYNLEDSINLLKVRRAFCQETGLGIRELRKFAL